MPRRTELPAQYTSMCTRNPACVPPRGRAVPRSLLSNEFSPWTADRAWKRHGLPCLQVWLSACTFPSVQHDTVGPSALVLLQRRFSLRSEETTRVCHSGSVLCPADLNKSQCEITPWEDLAQIELCFLWTWSHTVWEARIPWVPELPWWASWWPPVMLLPLSGLLPRHTLCVCAHLYLHPAC